MQRVDVYTQLPSGLSDRLIRLHRQFDRGFFKFSCIGIDLFLTHDTHLDRQVILPASVCPGNYSQFTDLLKNGLPLHRLGAMYQWPPGFWTNEAWNLGWLHR